MYTKQEAISLLLDASAKLSRAKIYEETLATGEYPNIKEWISDEIKKAMSDYADILLKLVREPLTEAFLSADEPMLSENDFLKDYVPVNNPAY